MLGVMSPMTGLRVYVDLCAKIILLIFLALQGRNEGIKIVFLEGN
jgi:hypothetical protein